MDDVYNVSYKQRCHMTSFSFSFANLYYFLSQNCHSRETRLPFVHRIITVILSPFDVRMCVCARKRNRRVENHISNTIPTPLHEENLRKIARDKRNLTRAPAFKQIRTLAYTYSEDLENKSKIGSYPVAV